MMKRENTLLRKFAQKMFNPDDLIRYVRYKFITGNEYLYFDFVDIFPYLADIIVNVCPVRLDIEKPIFLVGLRRSGTTLLYRIFNAHPMVELYSERFPGDRINGRQPGGYYDRNIWAIDDQTEFRRIVRRYLGLKALKKIRWGAKLALLLTHPNAGSVSKESLMRLVKNFPQAQFICIIRDPRDCIVSNIEREGFDVDFWASEYIAMDELFWEMHGYYHERVKLIHYEDLVLSPERTVKECCEFLGLPFFDIMLQSRYWSKKGPEVYNQNQIVAQVEKWRFAKDEHRETIEHINRWVIPQLKLHKA